MTPDWLAVVVASPLALFALGVAVAADGLFPPIPSEALLTALAALAVANDPSRLALIIPVAALGSVAGDLAAYTIGARLDPERLRLLNGARARRLVAWARPALGRRPVSFMVATRLLPGGRTVSCLACGMLGLPLNRFVPTTCLASIVWACYMAALGVGAAAWLSPNPLVAAVIGIVTGLLLGLVFDRVARLKNRGGRR